MNQKTLRKLFKEMGFVRTGGSKEEKECALKIVSYLDKLGLKAKLESFKIPDAKVLEGRLLVDNKEIKCCGYRLAKDATISAPLYYLANWDDGSLSQARGKIVLFTGYLNRSRYEELTKHGAVGFISTNGTLIDEDHDVDDRELRPSVAKDLEILPGVNINIKDAMKIINGAFKNATITLRQEKIEVTSHNVVCKLKGESEEEIILSAHYDSVPLSIGIYDNLSGTLGILGILEKFLDTKHHYTLTFLFCGSEERGLLGSKAYVKKHQKELDKVRLNINLDMIGTSLGNAIAVCTSDQKLVHFVEYLALIKGYPLKASQGVYSSDSTPFANSGVPALSLARIAPLDSLIIHNRHDQMKYMSMEKMKEDIRFAYELTKIMANAKYLPVQKEIPQNMKEEIDHYFHRSKPNK